MRELAFETGFMKRKSKKIDAPDFLALICLESQKGSPSYNDLASRLETLHQISASKQAICKKVNLQCVLFFQAVLSRIIKFKLAKYEGIALEISDKYMRVIVQDSTIIKLPLRLFKIFSGVSNAHTSVCNARIQGVYDILSGNFISFSIDSYSKNDLSAAPELEILEGDLVLRDRGYFTNKEVKRHADAGANCIYRHKHRTTYLSLKSRKAIDLAKLLKCKGDIDIEVYLNDKHRTKVRLIATAVSEEIANERRRKAKKEMKGHNPSVALLNMMSWTIFITTIPKENADIKKIFLIYSLRWRIEIIFKTWKSYMQFDKVHNVSENQLRILLIARFIMIVICTQHIYNPLHHRIKKEYKRMISMMKLHKYLMKNPEKIIEILSTLEKKSKSKKAKNLYGALVRYCTYDQRKRTNFHETALEAFA